MIRYVFKEPCRLKNAKTADPQKIGEALARAEASAGKLTPKIVVEAARSNRSPLHKHFEWDDAIAAEQYREEQARSLVQSIRAIEDDGEERPAYISVRDDAGTAYRSVGDVMKSLDLQMAVHRAALRDLKAWQQRYNELSEICAIVDEARRKLEDQIDGAAA